MVLYDTLRTLGLFIFSALFEILGCYLPYLYFRKEGSLWLLPLAALCLFIFAWSLSLHPEAAGRVYAAYGTVYVSMAFFWLWAVEGINPGLKDFLGMGIILTGMVVLMIGRKG